jgi:hypothetical protein
MEIESELYHIKIGEMQYCDGTIILVEDYPHIMTFCIECNIDIRQCQCNYCECCGVDKMCENSHKRCDLCYNFSIDCECYDMKCTYCDEYLQNCPCTFE